MFFDYYNLIEYHYKLPNGFKNGDFSSVLKDAFAYLDMRGENLDTIPDYFIKKYKLLSKKDSLRLLHFPKSMDDVKQGFRHLKYEEFLEFVLVMELSKRKFKEGHKCVDKVFNTDNIKTFISSLPYSPTGSQLRAFEEILSDLNSPLNMYRLLQGDVGSGKTLVAVLSAFAVIDAGFQVAFMAPTDILARQHFALLKEMYKDRFVVDLLVSDLKNGEKKALKERITGGVCNIVVGTHSLISDDVKFKNLGLAIIDEQHRFGVIQRQLLKDKGSRVDLLLMSATPIPRTLAHTIYGELDISTLDEFPSGKRCVESRLFDINEQEKMFINIEELLRKDNKVYVVCPLINSDNKDKKSVSNVYVEYYERFKEYGVGYLHGKMSNDMKNDTLNRFKNGELNLLISTSVIEVGIDIKDANVIVIYNANSFGLAQLHQLRGRVGRGKQSGYCFLVDELDGNDERLSFFKDTLDGFKISQFDMEKRGVGDIVGTKQSGVSDLRVSNVIKDYNILEVARKDSKFIFSNLDKLEFRRYLDYIVSKYRENVEVIN